MTTTTHDHGKHDTIRRLFYLMTCICEEGAQHAAHGQSPKLDEQAILELSIKLHSAGESLTILADAVRLFVGGEP